MKVLVVFEFKDITDLDGQDADNALAMIQEEIEGANISCDSWHVAETFGEDKT
jgi:hypothetical protein